MEGDLRDATGPSVEVPATASDTLDLRQRGSAAIRAPRAEVVSHWSCSSTTGTLRQLYRRAGMISSIWLS